MIRDLDFNLMELALQGDEVATKIYCGNYRLVMDANGNLFRCKDIIPKDYFIPKMNCDIYDKDGLLLDKYWSLPRV